QCADVVTDAGRRAHHHRGAHRPRPDPIDPEAAGMTTQLRRYLSPPVIALLLAIALFFSGGLVNPDFVNPTQAINIVRLAASLGIIAAGQTRVIISGKEGIDLSVGA